MLSRNEANSKKLEMIFISKTTTKTLSHYIIAKV